jgi:hypothetical protein
LAFLAGFFWHHTIPFDYIDLRSMGALLMGLAMA